MTKLLLLSQLVFFFASFANAFPEMVRHGYSRCTACHVSPSGGGVLTNYGRVLSNELLSTWRVGDDYSQLEKKDFQFLYGGDLRVVQTYLDTPIVREGKPILMQSDLEGAAIYRGFLKLVATAGFIDKAVTPPDEGYSFISRRHYGIYSWSESLSFRFGRFYPVFGIYQPNHTIVTRRNLGFDQNAESYNFEISWRRENIELMGTSIMGRPDDLTLDKEKGASLALEYSLFESSKAGMSFLVGENNSYERKLLGLNGIFSLSDSFFLLGEVDFQFLAHKSDGIEAQSGYVLYIRPNYEAVQGLNIYLPIQISHLDRSSDFSKTESYGVGIQFFPINHFELSLEISKQKTQQFAEDFFDVGYLLFHAYL